MWTVYLYGTIIQKETGKKRLVYLYVIKGPLELKTFVLRAFGKMSFLGKAFDKRREKKKLRKFRTLVASGKSTRFIIEGKKYND